MRVAFLNVQGGVGVSRGYWQYLTASWRYLLPHAPRFVEPLGAFLRAEGIELLGCVESELPSWRGRGLDYTEALASASGLPHRVALPTHRVGRLLHQGNSLCSRHPILAATNHRLPGRGEPRFAGEVRLQRDGLQWTAMVTHLSLSRPVRAEQLAALARLAAGRERLLLMGDFNTADRAELAPLLGAGLQRLETGPSYPSWRPTVPLDHLFASGDLAPLRVAVARELRLSDHLALVCEVVTPAEAQALEAQAREEVAG